MVEGRLIRGGYALLLLLLVACETDDPAGPSGPARAPALAAIEVPLLQTPALGATEVSTAPTFSWSSIAGANRYWLVVATSEVALPVDPNGTSCSGRCVIDANRKRTNFSPNTPLEPGTTYYWKVLPWNTDGTRGEFSIAGSFTTAGVPGPPDPTPIQAPQLLTPSSAASGVSTMPRFSWSSVAGANRYWLTVATSEAALPVDPSATSCSGTCVIDRNRGRTRFTPRTHLDPRTTYYWKVLPWNTDGTRGEFSRTGSFTTTTVVPPVNAVASVDVTGDFGGFLPPSLTVARGTTVVWRWSFNQCHSTTSDTGVWDSGILREAGATFSFRFDNPGTYHYHCKLNHGWIEPGGTVIVTP